MSLVSSTFLSHDCPRSAYAWLGVRADGRRSSSLCYPHASSATKARSKPRRNMPSEPRNSGSCARSRRSSSVNSNFPATLQAISEQLQTGLGYAGFHVWLTSLAAILQEAHGAGRNLGWRPHESDTAACQPCRSSKSPKPRSSLLPFSCQNILSVCSRSCAMRSMVR